MHLTTGETIPLTAVGTLIVSTATQYLTWPLRRREFDGQERRETRRAVTSRARQAAEDILNDALPILDEMGDIRRGGQRALDPIEVDRFRHIFLAHSVYLPDEAERERLEKLTHVLGWADRLNEWGGPHQGEYIRSMSMTIREELGIWLRTGVIPTSSLTPAPWYVTACAEGVMAYEDLNDHYSEMAEEWEREKAEREKARRDLVQDPEGEPPF